MSETTQPQAKQKLIAALLAFFFGWIGIHKFYLGNITWGVVYLVFSWTFIPSIASFVEFILLLIMSDEDFDKKYNQPKQVDQNISPIS